jgi:pantoate--beta-alanine ligase
MLSRLVVAFKKRGQRYYFLQGLVKLHRFLASTCPAMILFKKAIDLHKYVDLQREKGEKIGFIPTMGALHEGHISLIKEAAISNDITISSIFVNPTQFNDPADYQKYPVTIDKDIALLEEAGCDILFLPSVPEIYPQGTVSATHYDLGYIETILEGKYRPGHFQGVCRVVHRLLEIVNPHILFLGQKDYQQCMVINKLLEITGLNKTIQVNISPTLREKDGLAMSSRNMRLDEETRRQAPSIFESLRYIKTHEQPGDLSGLKEKASSFLTAHGFSVDYVEIADAASLQPAHHWDGKQKLVALAAAFLKDVRLIDNILLN